MAKGLPIESLAEVAGEAGRCFYVILSIPGRRCVGFEKRANVKNQCLNVVGALVQLPQFLVTACFVMENAHDHVAVDIFPTTRPIL